jgi:hypothetical protein
MGLKARLQEHPKIIQGQRNGNVLILKVGQYAWELKAVATGSREDWMTSTDRDGAGKACLANR